MKTNQCVRVSELHPDHSEYGFPSKSVPDSLKTRGFFWEKKDGAEDPYRFGKKNLLIQPGVLILGNPDSPDLLALQVPVSALWAGGWTTPRRGNSWRFLFWGFV